MWPFKIATFLQLKWQEDQTMKSFIKRLILVSSISTSLVLASVTVATELKAMPDTSVGTINSNILLPSQKRYTILPLTRVENAPNKTCKVVKRNELYELSAILNDKIHIFLSYFDSKPKYQIIESKEDKSALSMNRSINL